LVQSPYGVKNQNIVTLTSHLEVINGVIFFADLVMDPQHWIRYRYPTSITLLEIYLVVLDVLGQPEVVEFRLTRVPVRLDKYLSDPSQGFPVGTSGQEIHLNWQEIC